MGKATALLATLGTASAATATFEKSGREAKERNSGEGVTVPSMPATEETSAAKKTTASA